MTTTEKNSANILSITETDWAWFAGIIDGEGHIGFGLRNSRRRNAPQCKFQLTNTDPRMIDKVLRILRSLGIQPHVRLHEWKKSTKWKPAHVLVLSSKNQLLQVLPKVMPYLVCKAEQAGLVLSVAQQDFRSGPGRHVPEWVRSAIARVSELNHRGLRTTPSQNEVRIGEETRTSGTTTVQGMVHPGE